jgi:hypothetical protein
LENNEEKSLMMKSFMRIFFIHLYLFFSIILVFVFSSDALSKETRHQKPAEVTIGIYIMDVYDLDVRKGTYTADFYIWFKWKGDVNPRNFEIMNGYLAYKTKQDNLSTHGDYHHVAYRCRANLHSRFDLSAYPWDKQIISIHVEDEDDDIKKLIYVPDVENSKIHTGLNIHDWAISALKVYITDNIYETNFGKPSRSSDEKATYSRFTFDIHIDHKGFNLFLKTFLALFISVAIAFLTFLIHPKHYAAPRFSVCVTGMFGAVSSHIVVSQRIFESPVLTLADHVHFLGFFFIFLSVLESCVALKLYHDGRDQKARLFDLWSVYLFPVVFLISVMIAISISK